MLNTKKIGLPEAYILDDKTYCIKETIYLDSKQTSKHYNEIGLGFDDQNILFPALSMNPENPRDAIYISGKSGSGKSYWIKIYITQYKKKFPKNQIYLFSSKEHDEKLDEIGINRIELSEELVKDPIPYTDFANTLVIFDDIDAIMDKAIKKVVYNTANIILKNGRSDAISCIVTNHNPSDYQLTRDVLNECKTVIYFPFGATEKIDGLLRNYCGLPKEFSKVIKKKFKSRWVAIHNEYPGVFITEKFMAIINEYFD